MADGIVFQPDTVSLGRWLGKYGEGYWIARTNSGVTPAWITSWTKSTAGLGTITLTNTDNYLQVPGDSDSNSVMSLAAGNINLTMADVGAYVTSVYILSSTSPRQLAFKVQDVTGATTYYTYSDPGTWSSQGRWYRFLHWGGDCRLRLESLSGTIPLCGITFDRYVGQFGNSSEV